MLGRIVEEISRRERPRILAGLIARLHGDFDVAEEALQDAFERALATWPTAGIPDNPAAWITTTARNRAIDLLRRDSRHVADATEILEALAAPEDRQEGNEALPDERLALLFTCCNPALAPAAQMALALRTLCGLSTGEIARAFLEEEAATAQRIVRAKRKIAEARIPYRVPEGDELPERLAAVLATLYLMFNEGYTAAERPSLVRADLCAEAVRLAVLLAELMPGQAEAAGLAALMLLQDSRRDARLAPDGALVPLEEQDRSRWDATKIARGIAIFGQALSLRAPGPYQLQAAIAALHAKAATPADTDWTQISALYAALYRAMPTPVVALNAAAAFAMVAGPDKGLAQIDSLAGLDELRGYHWLPSARADLLRRAGPRRVAGRVRAGAIARPQSRRAALPREAAGRAGRGARHAGPGSHVRSTSCERSSIRTTHSTPGGEGSRVWMGRNTISMPPGTLRRISWMRQPADSSRPCSAMRRRRCARASARRARNSCAAVSSGFIRRFP